MPPWSPEIVAWRLPALIPQKSRSSERHAAPAGLGGTGKDARRWIRHPFYFAFALVVLANSLLAANAFLFVTGAAAFALIVRRTRREEANLLARFGEDYRRYVDRRGRFLPLLVL